MNNGLGKALVLIMLLGPLFAFGQTSGQLDAAFGQQGVVVYDVDDFDDVTAVESDANDRIFVLSQTGHNTSNGFDMNYSLSCFLSDGSADLSFGQSGNISADFTGYDYADPHALKVQSDGKILVLGKGSSISTVGTQPFCLVRYDANGTLDNSFGTNGEIQLNFLGDIEAPRSLELQSDGKILIAGATFDSAAIHEELPCIARLLPDGALDTTFGTSGKIAVDFSSGLIDGNPALIQNGHRHDNGGYFKSVLIQADGTLLCAGNFFNGQTYQSLIMSIFSDGTLNQSFGAGGILTFDLAPGYNSGLEKGALRADGSAVFILRKDGSATDHDFYLLGLSSSGQLEPLLALDLHGNQNFAEAVLFNPDGTLLVAGRGIDPVNYSPTYNSDFFEVAQLGDWMNDPEIDLSFGTGGSVEITVDATLPCGARAMTLLSDGSIVVAGFTETTDGVNTRDLSLIKLSGGSTFSTDELSDKTAIIQPYPNPTKGHVKFDIPADEMLLSCSLYDTSGRMVLQGTSSHSGKNFILDCSELSSGNYYLNIVTSADQYSAPVVVER